MKPLTVAALLGSVLGVSILLHVIQYGHVEALESRLARFERITTKAFASHLSALETTLAHQQILARIFMQSAELRLTFERLENYNAKTRPYNYTAAQGDYNGTAKELLRAERAGNGAQNGTGAWVEAVPVQASVEGRQD